MNLFRSGDFTLASGAKSSFKIECDSLSTMDWDALAMMAKEWELLPRFGRVFGVPQGGIPFANALEKFIDPTSKLVLIVDDVLTTGGSIKKYVQRLKDEKVMNESNDWVALVAFARSYFGGHRVRSIWNRGTGW